MLECLRRTLEFPVLTRQQCNDRILYCIFLRNFVTIQDITGRKNNLDTFMNIQTYDEFEYKVISTYSHYEDLSSVLNTYGKDGWEVVEIKNSCVKDYNINNRYIYIILLKRKLTSVEI